eukprot:TRINITY_DN1059_c0_g1_i1.p1 TRINITY_DN1059_c0_g1~~TRINITY_DN1059_c0_g1_i1.p1  ORF type:complete len:427 (+),score=249.51 TRINITY_DN1059_c0_g1_i1:198-1478(+)
MSNKAGVGWDGFKKTVARTKHSIATKVGSTPATRDAAFKQEKDIFDDRNKQLKKLEHSFDRYLRVLKDLTTAQADLAENIIQVYDQGSTLYNACTINQRLANNLEGIRVTSDDNLREHAIRPLSDYIQQYSIINKRMTERQRRLTDMDRYAKEVHDLEKKGDSPKLSAAREKYDTMSAAYCDLNDELMQDMQRLQQDRIIFFDPIFANIIDNQMKFFREATTLYGEIESQCRGIDRRGYLSHQFVITPEENSCYKKPITSYVGQRGDDYSHGGSSSSSSSSSSSTTSSTPAPAFGTPGTAAPGPGYNPHAHAGYGAPAATGGYGAPHGGYGAPAAGGYGAPPGGYNQPAPSGYGAPQMPVRAAPPPTPQRAVIKASALYAFQAQDPQELSFQPNDVLIIHSQQSEWWEAELNGRRGLIPANYVRLV